MKKITILTTLIFISVGLFSKVPPAQVFMSSFWHPNSGSYIELYVYSDPSGLTFKPLESEAAYRSGLEITTQFLSGDSVVAIDSELMVSPAMVDTTNSFEIVQLIRIAVPSGKYRLEVSLRDLYGTESIQLNDSVFIVEPSSISLSKLQLTLPIAPSERWMRYGIPVYPRSLQGVAYFANEDTLIQYYAELYQPQDTQDVAVFTSIVDANSGRTVSNSSRAFKVKASRLHPIALRYDLRELPTGLYLAKMRIEDRNQTVLARDSVKFGRYNERTIEAMDFLDLPEGYMTFIDAKTSFEELKRYVECLFPISEQNEKLQAQGLLNTGDSTQLHRFLDAFWNRRSPSNPSASFNEYMERVKIAENKYSTGNYPGYLTDRGRVWLQYGEPDMFESSTFDNATYPWEMWRYDRLTAPNKAPQVNKVFIFVNRDVAGRNFRLEHSDANGEPYNPQWKYQVNRLGTPPGVDGRSSNTNSDPFGSRLNNNNIMNGSTSSGYERR